MAPWTLKSFFLLSVTGNVLIFSNAVFAQTNTPTVYGRINVSLEKIDSDGASNSIRREALSNIDQWELNSNASRIGVKGFLDIEGTHIMAIYQIEYEINVDDGNRGDTAFSQRNTFAGLQGSFGEVRYGKFDTPLKSIEGRVDQFNDLRADFDVLIGGQNRVNNIIQYSSPILANSIIFTGALIAAEGLDVDQNGNADTGITDSISFSATYKNKSFYAALAYDQDQMARRSIDGIQRGDLFRLVSSWETGPIQLGILLQQTNDNLKSSDRQDTSFLISGSYRFGKFKYKAQFGASHGNTNDEDATLTAIGVDYLLTSKVILYTYWSNLNLDSVNSINNANSTNDVNSASNFNFTDTANFSDSTLGIGTSFSF